MQQREASAAAAWWSERDSAGSALHAIKWNEGERTWRLFLPPFFAKLSYFCRITGFAWYNNVFYTVLSLKLKARSKPSTTKQHWHLYKCWLYASHWLLGSRKGFKNHTRIRLCIDFTCSRWTTWICEIMEVLIKSAAVDGGRFFIKTRFEKRGNTVCISRFSNRRIGGKDPSSAVGDLFRGSLYLEGNLQMWVDAEDSLEL